MKRPPFEAERLYTPAEVADIFRVHTRTVDRWVATGRIDPAAIVRTPGGTRRYRAAAIDRLANGDPGERHPRLVRGQAQVGG